MPRRISIVSSSLGWSTITGWKRRSSAASRSMYLRYSSSVVAPIVCSSPRASDGFRILAASTAPSAAPAPTSVWSSSMNSTQLPEFLTSSMIFLRRSSNSPRYFVPATSEPMSRVSRRLPISVSGTSPDAIRWARPSTIAVLPTPDNRIELVRPCRRRQVHAELIDHRGLAGVARLLLRVALALVQDVDNLAADLVQRDAQRLQDT